LRRPSSERSFISSSCRTTELESIRGASRNRSRRPSRTTPTRNKRVVCGGRGCFNLSQALGNVFLTRHAHTGSDGRNVRRGNRPTRIYIGSFAQNRFFGIERI
jgi:hypothetical protein